LPGGCLCQARPCQVDLAHSVRQAELAELDGVGAEGVGEDDLRAGIEVACVQLGDGLGPVQVPLVGRDAVGQAGCHQHRSGGAVGD
jgi:hypothetical protein